MQDTMEVFAGLFHVHVFALVWMYVSDLQMRYSFVRPQRGSYVLDLVGGIQTLRLFHVHVFAIFSPICVRPQRR